MRICEQRGRGQWDPFRVVNVAIPDVELGTDAITRRFLDFTLRCRWSKGGVQKNVYLFIVGPLMVH